MTMLKMLLKKSVSHLECAFAGIVFGIIAYFLFAFPISYFKLTINPQVTLEIDPTSIISLLVTIGLAVFVVRALQRKDDGDKVERDLLISYFREFESRFSQEIEQMVSVPGTRDDSMVWFWH